VGTTFTVGMEDDEDEADKAGGRPDEDGCCVCGCAGLGVGLVVTTVWVCPLKIDSSSFSSLRVLKMSFRTAVGRPLWLSRNDC
jgi:hypothetical protein